MIKNILIRNHQQIYSSLARRHLSYSTKSIVQTFNNTAIYSNKLLANSYPLYKYNCFSTAASTSQSNETIIEQPSLLTKATTTAASTITENHSNVYESEANPFDITVTDKCAEELNKVKKDPKLKDIKLRVMVDTGGCSGFQYIIKLDNKVQEDDYLFNKNGAQITIDKISLDMMHGSVIDYETELMRSSFCVAHNPNTIKSCGCKISFDLKKK